MNQPKIEVLPLRSGVSIESPTDLKVMVRITPPETPAATKRPLLNLALVIDRSGSMTGQKLGYAKQAAAYAVQSLLPDDRVSVVTYDDKVNAIVPSTLAANKASIVGQIETVQPGGTTALHDGWLEGAAQVSTYLDPERLNRVILLSDGLANVGETNPDIIASDVAGLKEHGVSTTTLGVGRDFNEDLMQAIATSGEGTFYFIESPDQLPNIFAAELQGLITTRGTGVKLELRSSTGASITELLNDFPTSSSGQLVLPNLASGMPILLAGTLHIPLKASGSPIGDLHLSWHDVDTGKRQTLTHSFNLPAMTDVTLQNLPENPEVASYFAEMYATRAKEEAMRRLDRGDRAGMRRYLDVARSHIQRAPASPRIDAELRELEYLEEAQRSQDDVITRKRMKDQVYRKKFSRGLEASRSKGSERVRITRGDIIQERVDAIVNPTNTRLFGTGGTDGAVHRAAGPELTRACREIGHCEPGKAVFTDGFNLPARFVIHTVGPKWQGGHSNEARTLASCYRSSLQLATKLGVKTIAFPSISTGTYAYPLEDVTAIALQEITTFLTQDVNLEQVRIVCFDAPTFEAYQRVFHRSQAVASPRSS